MALGTVASITRLLLATVTPIHNANDYQYHYQNYGHSKNANLDTSLCLRLLRVIACCLLGCQLLLSVSKGLGFRVQGSRRVFGFRAQGFSTGSRGGRVEGRCRLGRAISDSATCFPPSALLQDHIGNRCIYLHVCVCVLLSVWEGSLSIYRRACAYVQL